VTVQLNLSPGSNPGSTRQHRSGLREPERPLDLETRASDALDRREDGPPILVEGDHPVSEDLFLERQPPDVRPWVSRQRLGHHLLDERAIVRDRALEGPR
jgi:hypothetical protein